MALPGERRRGGLPPLSRTTASGKLPVGQVTDSSASRKRLAFKGTADSKLRV